MRIDIVWLYLNEMSCPFLFFFFRISNGAADYNLQVQSTQCTYTLRFETVRSNIEFAHEWTATLFRKFHNHLRRHRLCLGFFFDIGASKWGNIGIAQVVLFEANIKVLQLEARKRIDENRATDKIHLQVESPDAVHIIVQPYISYMSFTDPRHCIYCLSW